MAIYKNKASQKVAVFAVDADGAAKTGDAANITAQISLDGAGCAATNDTNPTELDATDAPGIYLFDLTQAETNANLIVLAADSSTSGVVLRPVVIYTEPETRAADVTSLSGDSTAADNAESFFDGTGYAGTNNVIPTVTSVTNAVTAGTVSDKTGYGLTSAYDAAKTAAQAGDEMDLVDAPNGTAVTAIQSGLSTHSAADVAAAVWAALTSGLTTAGSIGKYLLDHIVGILGTGTHTAQSGDSYAEIGEAGANLTVLATSSQAESISQAITDLNDISTSDVQAIIDVIAGAGWTNETLAAIKAAIDALEAGAAPTVEEIDTQLSTTHGSGAWGGAVGSGGTQYQWPEDGDPVVDDDGSPLDGVAVWITSDEAGATTVAGPQYTLATGYVANKWLLDAGTYYAWVQLARYDAATNPTEITVS